MVFPRFKAYTLLTNDGKSYRVEYGVVIERLRVTRAFVRNNVRTLIIGANPTSANRLGIHSFMGLSSRADGLCMF